MLPYNEPVPDGSGENAPIQHPTPMSPLTLPLRRNAPKTPPERPEFCLNCGFLVEHNFCPVCGQENMPSRVAFGALMRDAWDDLVRIDAKLLKTLVPLLFKPGFLTQEYVAGRRVRYLSPFKMYLVISALFFLLVSWRGAQQINKVGSEFSQQITQSQSRGPGPSAPMPPGGASSAHAAAAGSTAAAKTQEKAAKQSSKPQESASRDNAAASIDMRPLKHGTVRFRGGEKIEIASLPLTVEDYRAQQDALEPSKRHSAPSRFFRERIIRLNRYGIEREILSALLSNIPNMMFFLVPVFALFLKILYIRSRKLYVEHLVYALHLHSFFFLLAGLDVAANDTRLQSALLIAFVFYGFVALKCFYGQSIPNTILKGSLLVIGYFWLLVVGFVLTVLTTLALV